LFPVFSPPFLPFFLVIVPLSFHLYLALYLLSFLHMPSFASFPSRRFTFILSQLSRIRTALFWAVTQCVVVIPSRRFGTTCWSHLPRVNDWIGCPETSGWNYHYTLRNSPEERRSHLLRGGSLKSRMALTISRSANFCLLVELHRSCSQVRRPGMFPRPLILFLLSR